MPLFVAFTGTTLAYLVVREFDPPVWLSLVTKPVPVLLLLAALVGGRRTPGRKWPTALALVFSLVGDVALVFRSDAGFLIGLGGFLVAHLCYVAAFAGKPELTGRRLAMSVALIPYGVALNALLWSHTGPMRLPVAAYSVVLLGMVVVALLSRGVPVHAKAGAAVFAASDSLLALQLFGYAFPGGGLVSMALYEAAQWLLVAPAPEPATESSAEQRTS